MAKREDLMGVGMAAALADRLGYTNLALTAVGTSSAGAALITSKAVTLTTSSGQTAVRLPNTPGDFFWITNPSATTALIFPPTGGTINGGSTDASVNLAQNHAACFWIPTSLVVVTIPSTP